MQPHRKLILTGTALFCRCAAWYPIWLLVLSLGKAGGVYASMCTLLLCSVPAAVCVRICRLHFRKNSLRARFFSAAATVLAAAASIYMVRHFSGSLIAACITAGLTVLCPLRGIEAEPEDLFPVNAYVAFLTGAVIVTAMLSVAHLPAHSGLTLCAVGLISALYFLLRNQFMLLRFVNRRSSTEADVPKEIRRSNLMLVLGVILLLAVLWVFRAPLLHLMAWMQDAARWLAGTLLELITRLIARLGGNAPDPMPADTGSTAPEPSFHGKSNPLWMLLWIPVFAIALYMWRTLLSDWVYDIRLWISQLLRKFRHDEDAEAACRRNEAAEYYDTETVLRPEQTARKRRMRWKKALRRWQKLPDSTEKFYAGYQLLLQAPCWTDSELCDSDTVREIREKWMQHHTPQDALDAVTDAFHTDRYAEQGLPSEAIAALTHALQALTGITSR